MNIKTHKLSISIALVLMLSACGGGGGRDEIGSFSIGEIQRTLNTSIANNAIIPGYEALLGAFTELKQASDNFCGARIEDNLVTLRQAWRSAMSAWSAIQLVEVGPIGDNLRIRTIQTFPEANTPLATQVDAILAGPDTLNEAFFLIGSTQTRGLPALEYLLFDNAQLSDQLFSFTAAVSGDRRCDYVVGVSGTLEDIASAVLNGWLPTGGNFVGEFTLASGSSTFASQLDVIDDLANDFIDQVSDIANRKLNGPLGAAIGAAQPQAAESWRSENSVANLMNNLSGLRQIYSAGSGFGYDDYLIDVLNASVLNTTILNQITLAQNAVTALVESSSGSVTNAVVNASDRGLVENVLTQVNQLVALFSGDFIAVLAVNQSFNESDGDGS